MKTSKGKTAIAIAFAGMMTLPTSEIAAEDTLFTAEESEISVPIIIDLAHVQRKANAHLPTRLATFNDKNVLCVEAEWMKTKVPEFRGWKIYSRMVKIQLTPNIYCDVEGYVDRRGELSINVTGQVLKFSLPVHAKATARVSPIQETAKADATFFVNAKLNIGEDWRPKLSLNSDFRWDKRPEIWLFDIVKVTIGSKVAPKLRKKMAELEQQVPAMLDDLDLRGEMEKVWTEVQKPVKISDNPTIYAVFTPNSVGFSGLNGHARTLTTQIAMRGKTHVVIGEAPTITAVPLPPLERIEANDGHFALYVPVMIEEAELQRVIDAVHKSALRFEVAEGALQGNSASRP